MTRFILNHKTIETDLPTGSILLDYIRYHKALTGTKIGCREGDCGACTILVGEVRDGQLQYQSMTSCLMPIGNAQGKHIVTIEGLNVKGLTPVQQAVVDQGGTQCGFCTVGFIVSLHGYCLSKKEHDYQNAIAAIDGNICRCTGYKSLERACQNISDQLGSVNFQNEAAKSDRDTDPQISWLVENNYIPQYFTDIKKRLAALTETKQKAAAKPMAVGGGTDLYVQQPEEMAKTSPTHLFNKGLNSIKQQGRQIHIGAAATAEDLQSAPEMQAIFPNLCQHIKLVSSTPIRNMGTLGGNLVNASPIGDLTVFFLALDSSIILTNGTTKRQIKLKDFYKGYKKLDKQKEEIIETILFDIPPKKAYFNFEKVCKRTHLDIATVNTAISLLLKGDLVEKAQVSIGGVGPIPTYLHKTSAYLAGKTINPETIQAANEILQQEISPISDVRGSKEYKRLLAQQLFHAHFIAVD